MELVEAAEKHAPLNDQIAQKIDKTRVMCFLKDYDKSYASRFERTFPVVKLYIKEVANVEAAETLPLLGAATPPATLQRCASESTEKEKQLFGPSIKGVVDEIAVEIGVDDGLPLPNAVVKSGIVFDNSATEGEVVLLSEENPSLAHEVSTSAAGSTSPIKKLKNAPGRN